MPRRLRSSKHHARETDHFFFLLPSKRIHRVATTSLLVIAVVLLSLNNFSVPVMHLQSSSILTQIKTINNHDSNSNSINPTQTHTPPQPEQSSFRHYTWEEAVNTTLITNTSYNTTPTINTPPVATATMSFRWIAPQGRPYLTSRDIVTIFQQENTLWIGDSTGRQDYQTMYSLLDPQFVQQQPQHMGTINEKDDESNKKKNTSIASTSTPTYYTSVFDINKKSLNRNINKGKGQRLVTTLQKLQSYHCAPVKRNMTLQGANVTSFYRDMGELNHEGTRQGCVTYDNKEQDSNGTTIISPTTFADLGAFTTATTIPITTTGTATTTAITGRLDLTGGFCFDTVRHQIKQYRAELQGEYSVIIFSVGIWESQKAWDCRKPYSADLSVVEVYKLLDYLHTHVASPSLYIIWKLHGPSDHPKHSQFDNRDNSIAAGIRDWFAKKTKGKQQQQQHYYHGNSNKKNNATGTQSLASSPSVLFIPPLLPYMALADFRYAVRDRTYHAARNRGDMKPHWGLEARLLSIDMVARLVDQKQKANR